VIQVGLLGAPFEFAGRYVCGCGKKYGPIGGAPETAVIPDEVGVLDGGDVVEGFGAGDLATGRRVIWWFVVVTMVHISRFGQNEQLIDSYRKLLIRQAQVLDPVFPEGALRTPAVIGFMNSRAA
jgi:hypothetical protein